MNEPAKPSDPGTIALTELLQEYRAERSKTRKDLDAAHEKLRRMRKDRFGWKAWLKATATLVVVELVKATVAPWLLRHIPH